MQEIFNLINEMSPFLLLGFLLAGLMHAFIPNRIYTHYLSGSSFKSVLYAALFGVPLPLCSCGVIPTAMSMRKEGASKGATVSFLIATPQTGLDSIFATYSLLGLPFAIIRPFVAFFTALIGGQAVNLFNKETSTTTTHTEQREYSEQHHSFVEKIVEALRYGFVEMMGDIGKWLVIGLIIAGLITTFVPQEFFAVFADNSFMSILLVLCISIPMYVCATGSIPIAVALMLKGLTPGAALVLLMAGPAANAASILIINKVLGRKTLIIYLSAIALGAIGFGLGIDYLLPREWFIPTLAQTAGCCNEHVEWFNIGCTILLALLLLYALINHLRGHDHCHECNEDACSADATDTTMRKYRIEGMNCSHCAKNAENAIRKVEGVEHVSVDLASETAVVKGDASETDIAEAVESLGFKLVKNGNNH
jgi:uncharacterized membrane protein YraQ (UPF0718 family)/copper chaperone CopZ